MSEATDGRLAYPLDEGDTVVVLPTVDGDRYVLRDTAVHRAAMAAAFGLASEEAVSLRDYTGHRPGPVDDRRGKDRGPTVRCTRCPRTGAGTRR
jgi:hypothetical protein